MLGGQSARAALATDELLLDLEPEGGRVEDRLRAEGGIEDERHWFCGECRLDAAGAQGKVFWPSPFCSTFSGSVCHRRELSQIWPY